MEKIVREQPKNLTSEDISYILKLKRSDVDRHLLKKLFGIPADANEAKFRPNDKFTLPSGKFYNKTNTETTIGRYIFNMFCLPIEYLKKYGYLNIPLNKGNLGDLEASMCNMLLSDELTTKQYAEYLDNSEWLVMSVAYFISPSLTSTVVVPIPEVIKRSDELFDEYKDDIAKADLHVASKIEKELLGMARKHIEATNDPAIDYYDSGSTAFAVGYKKGSILIGGTADVKGKFEILKSNYTDGVSKTEYDKAAHLTTLGGMSRGVSTQKYGYETKKYNSSLQNVMIDEITEDEDGLNVDVDSSNIDCGTTRFLDITITKSNKKMFMYRFILDGGKLVELIPENIDNYIDKTVKMRSPMFCKGDSICEHCAGTLFKRTQMKNVGLVASNMTGNLLNLYMKKMHDSTVTTMKMDIEKFITDRD